MTLPGLALFYGGLVRAKNVLSILMQCFAIAGISSILWLVVGYSLAFGEGGPLIGDFSKVMLSGIGRDAVAGVFSGYGFAEGIQSMAGQMKVQFIGVAATIVFTAVVTYVLLKAIDLVIGLRVTEEQEVEGLDIALHEERGYVGL